MAGTPIMVRLQDEALAELDAWRRKQSDLPTRPEALRRLMDKALNGTSC
jgi:hypothetical protein